MSSHTNTLGFQHTEDTSPLIVVSENFQNLLKTFIVPSIIVPADGLVRFVNQVGEVMAASRFSLMEGGYKLHYFGPFCLDASERVLLRDGALVPLPPKVITTLLVLLRSRGHVVEKDVLMEEVWPNDFVEEGNLAQHIFILRKALSEGTDGTRYIETVPRRGYRFLSKVIETDVAAGDAPGEPSSRWPDFCLIAVLPLVNASRNHDVEHLSDGITESIMSALSEFPELRVMARNTVLHYKDRELDAREVGRELGVHNVLIGTLQSHGDMIMFSVELVDVARGWRLCGKTYTRKLNDFLETQDAIVREISRTIRINLKRVEEQRRSRRLTESREVFRS